MRGCSQCAGVYNFTSISLVDIQFQPIYHLWPWLTTMINRERQDDVWVKKCSPEKPEPHSRGSFRFDPQRRSAALPLVRAATLPSPGPLRLATRAPLEAARPREEAALPSTQASHVGCRPAWNPEPIKYTNNFWITGSLDYWIRLMEKIVGEKSQVTTKI